MRMKVILCTGVFMVIGFMLASHVSAGCGNFYKDNNYSGGSPLTVCDGGSEYVNLSNNGWNDKISSYKIDNGTECVLTKDSNFSGDSLYVTGEKAGMPSGWNDAVSSIKCAAVGYFTTNDMPYGHGAVYEHHQYAGRVLELDNSTNIPYVGVLNDVLSSAKIGKGIQCDFCKDRDFKNCGKFGPNNKYPKFRDIGWNDVVSSIKCYPAGY